MWHCSETQIAIYPERQSMRACGAVSRDHIGREARALETESPIWPPFPIMVCCRRMIEFNLCQNSQTACWPAYYWAQTDCGCLK
jgi:hypothetical protein